MPENSSSSRDLSFMFKHRAKQFYELGFNVLAINSEKPEEFFRNGFIEEFSKRRQSLEEFENQDWNNAIGYGIIASYPSSDGKRLVALTLLNNTINKEIVAKGLRVLSQMKGTLTIKTPDNGKQLIYLTRKEPDKRINLKKEYALELITKGFVPIELKDKYIAENWFGDELKVTEIEDIEQYLLSIIQIEEELELEKTKTKFKCKQCIKFKTKECDVEDGETEACEDFVPKESEAIIQYFSEKLIERYIFKHFIKEGKSVGLYRWKDGIYVQCEEDVKKDVEILAIKLGIQEKIKNRIVNEIIEKIKRRTQAKFTLGYEPSWKMPFLNLVIDWRTIRNIVKEGKPIKEIVEKAFLPIESTIEDPCLNQIPYEFTQEMKELFKQGLDNLDNLENFIESKDPNIVQVFKAWANEKWILLLEIIGYCMYPRNDFQLAFMLLGPTESGKTTYSNLVETILGKDNVAHVSLHTLEENNFAAAETLGKLAIIWGEISAYPIYYSDKFKALTGEIMMRYEKKHRDAFDFPCYAKPIFGANKLPKYKGQEGSNEAFFRRWIIIKFPNKFGKVDIYFFETTFTKEVIEKIIVYSLLAFIRVLKRTGELRQAKFSFQEDYGEEWLRESDSVYNYIKSGIDEGRIILDDNEKVEADILYNDYLDFCNDNDIQHVEKGQFTKSLLELFGIEKTKARIKGERKWCYRRVKLVRTYAMREPEEQEKAPKLL